MQIKKGECRGSLLKIDFITRKDLTAIIPIGIIAAMDNRSAILECALNLFASRGYDAVGVQEIVETLDLSKPTLYHYFGNKQGLLQALLESSFTGLIDSVRAAAEYHHDLPYTLAKIAAAYFQFAESNPTFYRLQLSMSFSPADSEAFKAVAPFQDQQRAILEELFIQAVPDHGNMRNRHKDYAATFIGMVNTYIALALNGAIRLDEGQLHRAVHQFQHGIYS
jgi:AcrR family transcriptional regulator